MLILADLAGKGMKISDLVAQRFFQDGLLAGFSVLDLATCTSEELCTKRGYHERNCVVVLSVN